MDLGALLPTVHTYLKQDTLTGIPGWGASEPLVVSPLAQGEHYLNYLVQQRDRRWVLCVNIGSQIRCQDQIVYEYRALRLLDPSGVPPYPYDVDDSRTHLDCLADAPTWVTYQTGAHAVKNTDTFRKVTSYLDLAFQREMFDPDLEAGTAICWIPPRRHVQ